MKRMTIIEHSNALESMNISDAEKWHLHCQRKNFGKQILTLGMFIPCDEYGNILTKPAEDDHSFYTHKNISVKEEYKQAKERVLFKGWKVDKITDEEIYLSSHQYTGLVFDHQGNTTGKIIKTVEDTLQRDILVTEYGMSQFNIGITNH